MKSLLTDINSDRINVLRYVSMIFKNQIIINKYKKDIQFNREYQKLSSKYQFRLKKLINVIKSNNDYRIPILNTQFNEIITYFNGLSNVLKVTNSDLLISDMGKVLIQYMESKFSDLIKIDII